MFFKKKNKKEKSIVLVNFQVAAVFLHKYITFQPQCSQPRWQRPSANMVSWNVP